MSTYAKRRPPARPGSIPDRLQMFGREVRFYREVAPRVGIRVPHCHRAEIRSDGSTFLELEDLSSWRGGADPTQAATVLSELHRRWEGTITTTWPWLPRPDASDLVEALYAKAWSLLRERQDVSAEVRDLGDSLLGRVADVEREAELAGPPTMTHGDSSLQNMRTSSEGEVVLLDWEDLGAGPGVSDLAWLLVSSVDPEQWDSTIDAYGTSTNINAALQAAAVQGLLTLHGEREGAPEAEQWVGRLNEARRRTK